MVIAGGGSVLAAAGGSSSDHSSAKSQYCPPSSPQGGQPQGGPENNCGNGTPGGPPEKPPHKKHKPKPKVHVHAHPSRGCTRHNFRARIALANVPRGQKARVYRDGHLIRTTSARSFNVVVNARRLKRGKHTLTVRVRGADGKWSTHKVPFRRC